MIFFTVHSVSAATPLSKQRGRPKLNAPKMPSHTAVSGALDAMIDERGRESQGYGGESNHFVMPAKRQSRALSG